MATVSIIYKSSLEGSTRIDAEYYQPYYLKLDAAIKKYTNMPLKKLGITLDCSLFYPSIAPFYQRTGIPFIRIDDIQNGIIVLNESSVFLPEEVLLQNPKTISRCNPGDIVIAKGGNTIGKVGLLNDCFSEYATCRDLIIVKTGSAHINRYYLLAFLLSTVGQSLMIRTASQTGQPHLTIVAIRELRIPVVDIKLQNQFEDIILKSQRYFLSAMTFYNQAEQLLLSELGLLDWKPRRTLTYVRSFNQVAKASRMDAEHFHPKYKEMFDRLPSNVYLQLLGKITLYTKGIEVGSSAYTESGIPFLRVSNLSKHGIVDDSVNFISDELYNVLREKYEPQQGEILLSKDATPGIAYFLDESVQGIIASGILRLSLIEDIPPYYLELVLNSIFVQLQIEQSVGGSIIKHWKPSQVQKTWIPRLLADREKEISALVQQSHAARREAKTLLEKAKRAVEIAIEEGEERAMEFLS